MKGIIEENNQEVEFIDFDDLEEMKPKLYAIEKKFSKGIATNEEVNFLIDIVQNTGDYSDILKTPGQKEMFEFSAKSDYQAMGSLLEREGDLTDEGSSGSMLEAVDKIKACDDNKKRTKDTLAHMTHWLKLVRINDRIRKKGLDIYVRARTRKPFKKELDSFFELLDNKIQSNEAYAKKWL